MYPSLVTWATTHAVTQPSAHPGSATESKQSKASGKLLPPADPGSGLPARSKSIHPNLSASPSVRASAARPTRSPAGRPACLSCLAVGTVTVTHCSSAAPTLLPSRSESPARLRPNRPSQAGRHLGLAPPPCSGWWCQL